MSKQSVKWELSTNLNMWVIISSSISRMSGKCVRKLFCSSFFCSGMLVQHFYFIWLSVIKCILFFFFYQMSTYLYVCVSVYLFKLQRTTSGKVKAYLSWRRPPFASKAVALLPLPCKEQPCSHQPCLGRCWHHHPLYYKGNWSPLPRAISIIVL